MAIRCAACNEDNDEGASYCAHCGSQLGVGGDVDPLIGRVIAERYRVVRVIGEGGMGRVYLAEQQMGTVLRKVAVKVLHALHSHDETLRKRFYRECEVVAHLTHPNTIQFYDFGELPDGRLYIVMEYLEGISLAQALLSGPLPLPRVERLLTQIAGSLGEAHAHGVVHRDLKPENIMLTSRGGEEDVVKVCDFGIAKQTGSGANSAAITLQGTVVGTLQYMSPEQLVGGDIDARSDVYSLGNILFEMLAGERPFMARTPIEWAARHTTAEPRQLESFAATRDLPPEKKKAVMRALEKLPEDRQSSARELAAEFVGRTDSSVTPTAFSAAPASPAAPRNGVDVTAPTLHAAPIPDRRSPQKRSRVLLFGVLLGVVGIASGGLALFFSMTKTDGATARVPPVLRIDAGTDTDTDAGGSSEPIVASGAREFFRIVQYIKSVDDPALALGPPDGRYAVIHPGGTLHMEVAAGRRMASDGGPGPDFLVQIDDARSGPYRADVGVARHRFTTVGSELVGSLPLDIDQFEIRRARYVRIKNRGTGDVLVDAVGVFQIVEMADHEE